MSIKKDAVVAIIQKGDTFLFVKRSDYIDTAAGYWCPVSGRVEENETQIEALEREVMEEVGLSVKALEKICEIPSHNNQFILHFWTIEIISGEASITSNEATDFRWVTLEQMKQLAPVFEEDIQVFEKLSQ
jgi:8-oxo-dGTP pyrophosphatase MutT (NUDIX family)